MVRKHNPSELSNFQNDQTLLPLPVNSCCLDVNSVPVVAAVTVGSQGASGPHANSVHVIPEQEDSQEARGDI